MTVEQIKAKHPVEYDAFLDGFTKKAATTGAARFLNQPKKKSA